MITSIVMEDRYPSYRRFCHKNIPYNQNILSAVVIINNEYKLNNNFLSDK